MNMNVATNILIVDDEPRIVRAISRLLKPSHQTFTAHSADEALDIVRQNRINVIVSDQRMPGTTGVELLAKVKEMSSSTMRILLTGYSDLNAVTQSVNDGEIYRYITKPWNNAELTNVIRQAALISVDLFKVKKSLQVKASSAKKTDIIVFSPEQNLIDDVKGLMGRSANISVHNSMINVAEHLSKNRGQILVADISNSSASELQAVKYIKSKYPQMLSVIVTDSSDSQHLISLINEGQIYRYLTKPYALGQLKLYLMSSVRYQSKLEMIPQLAARHAVEQVKDESLSTNSNTLFSKFKALLGLRS